jgi:hypothetical protein
MKFFTDLFGKKNNENPPVISLLSPEQIKLKGNLPSKAICGKFENGINKPEYFIENIDFANFLHEVIADKAIDLKSLRDGARKQLEGYIYIIDFRTPEGIMGNVPSEDIIGAFKIENGTLVKNSYWRNDKYKIYTKNGLIKLPPEIDNLIIEELMK